MNKTRELIDELMEAVDAMVLQREGKITLRTREIEELPPLEFDPATIREMREKLQ